MTGLAQIFINIFIISITSYSGSAQILFYDIGVQQLKWITNQDFTSYLGFGFASPGPQVFSLATFMGWGKAGIAGAVVGTIAIYLMPVVLAILSGKYLKKIIHNRSIQYFVKSIALAAAGLLGSMGFTILFNNPVSPLYVFIAGASAVAINRKVSPLIIITAGLLLGLGIR